jgi:signal transduction histidine kinase
VGVVLVTISVALSVYLLRNQSTARQEAQRLRLSASLVVEMVERNRGNGNVAPEDRLQALAERSDATLRMRVVVVDEIGQVIVDSRLGSEAPIPAKIVASRIQTIVPTYRDQDGQAWIYVVRPLSKGRTLVVTSPRPKLNAAALFRDELFSPFLRIGLAAMGFALALAFLVARWVAAPLQRIAAATRLVAEGRYQTIPLEGPSEVQTVASAFNEMSERVNQGQQSQRDFVANVSHELKTPITSIQGFAQAMLDGTVDTLEQRRQAAQVIFDESTRMHRLVLELLDLARLESGIAEMARLPVEMVSLLEGVVEKFAPQAHLSQISIALTAEEPLVVSGDTDRLAQLFANLLDNALKFSPPGDSIELRLSRDREFAEIAVADSGPGIPPQDLGRVFERFYQTDKSRRGGASRGIGLGLAIAREIALAHGGSITAFNRGDPGGTAVMAGSQNPGSHGSVFVVKIPIAEP